MLLFEFSKISKLVALVVRKTFCNIFEINNRLVGVRIGANVQRRCGRRLTQIQHDRFASRHDTADAAFSRYKDSYLLYSFRLIDLLRASKSAHLTKLLSSQATYLYHFACLMKYKDIQKYEVQQLIEWAINASPDMDLQQFRIEFMDKTTELNLRSCQPKSFTYTFTTIWDTMHFLSLIIDDMVYTRDKSSLDFVMQQLKTMKVLFYNVFFILQCAMCRDHYMNVKGFLIYHIELIEIALDKENTGQTLRLSIRTNRKPPVRTLRLCRTICS